MKKILFSFILLSVLSLVKAQQEAQYTQYMVNPFLYNPALSGCEDFLDIKTGFRTQWTGIEGAPRTMYLSAHGPLSQHHAQRLRGDKDSRRHSVGGLIGSDKAGDIYFNSAYASYSYTMTLSKGHFFGFNNHKRGIELALGTSAGVKQYRLDLDRINNSGIVESVILDPNNLNKILPDFSLGSWLYMGDYIYLGLSAQQLLRNRLSESKESRLFQHYNLVGGTEFRVGEEIKILPSAMVKKVAGAPITLDLNCRLDYQDKYFGGMSLRAGDAISVLLGMLLKDQYEIAYSYDFTVSKLSNYNSGTHELMLGIRFYPHLSVRNAEDAWR
jgi:type IX secretion system PorP/SprF family membrane protein